MCDLAGYIYDFPTVIATTDAMVSVSSNSVKSKWFTILWKICNFRNLLVWQNKVVLVSTVVRLLMISCHIGTLRSPSMSVSNQFCYLGCCLVTKPEPSLLKCKIDALCIVAELVITFDAFLRYAEGHFFASLIGFFLVLHDSLIAETMSIREALLTQVGRVG
ncbi:hypothetical protein ES332_A11G124300v1 [Gossypium tomentosum]|uniref:Uncharacterized protein n=1 Tax=Gossypium tomentosum TaxID=34277 RepID=A0A5D2N9W1_GOSTO|nr:hypothetical protein ES332_A11G124300v1 [Gossypium tomentosum]